MKRYWGTAANKIIDYWQSFGTDRRSVAMWQFYGCFRDEIVETKLSETVVRSS